MSENEKNRVEFCIYIFHKLAQSWETTAADVYHTLEAGGLVKGYLLEFYDVLHTFGTQYLVDDITELARNRGLLA